MKVVKNGKVFINGGLEEVDILIKGKRIVEIGKDLEADEVIDASGKVVLPGLIDVHVHFRVPGHPHKEDYRSGSKAAAAGGVTTVFTMPNTNPPIISQENLDLMAEHAKESIVNYGLYAGASPENLEDIDNISCDAIKAYIGSSTGTLLLDNPADLVKLFENTDKLVVTHAEDEELVKYFSQKNKETGKHHLMRDNLAALIATSRVVLTANYMDKRVHIAHMSTGEEVEFLRQHKEKNVTCETCPHHLFLDKDYHEQEGPLGKMNPPLRYDRDVELLWEGLNEGTIDIIATDHAPHTLEEKQSENAPCGVPGVQTTLSLMLDAVHKEKISLKRMVEVCCTKPAECFNIKDRGRIEEGYYADLALVDFDEEKEITNEQQYSKCGWTPFHGKKVKGWNHITIVNGEIVYEEGEFNIMEGMRIEN